MGHPDADALLAAVEAFLRQQAAELDGRAGFHARVAANALAIVRREAQQQPQAAAAQALAPYGGVAGLCAGLRSGRWQPHDPALLEAVRQAVLAQLAVDNPGYPTLARLAARPVADG